MSTIDLAILDALKRRGTVMLPRELTSRCQQLMRQGLVEQQLQRWKITEAGKLVLEREDAIEIGN